MATKKPMTKTQLVAHLAGKFELTKNTAKELLDELTRLAVTETKKTGSFTLPGIGKIVLSKRKARTGRNPQTGEPIKIPAKTVTKMRIAKAFKDAVVPPKKIACVRGGRSDPKDLGKDLRGRGFEDQERRKSLVYPPINQRSGDPIMDSFFLNGFTEAEKGGIKEHELEAVRCLPQGGHWKPLPTRKHPYTPTH